jgi:hypothetical protein
MNRIRSPDKYIRASLLRCNDSTPTFQVGLTLDEPAQITEIEYIFRNDDNSIREDDVYELFYFFC